MTDVFALLRAGLAHHQAGRVADAEAQYQAALAAEPEHAYALYLLGLLRMPAG
jgi:tetratricopeptide (TPR) repeat protein